MLFLGSTSQVQEIPWRIHGRMRLSTSLGLRTQPNCLILVLASANAALSIRTINRYSFWLNPGSWFYGIINSIDKNNIELSYRRPPNRRQIFLSPARTHAGHTPPSPALARQWHRSPWWRALVPHLLLNHWHRNASHERIDYMTRLRM